MGVLEECTSRVQIDENGRGVEIEKEEKEGGSERQKRRERETEIIRDPLYLLIIMYAIMYPDSTSNNKFTLKEL